MAFPIIKRNRYVDESGFPRPHTGKNHAEDMLDFHLPLAQTHNANLYSWGIANGMEVYGTLQNIGNEATPSKDVTIMPGVAIDAFGNLIVLAESGSGDIGIDPAGGQSNLQPSPVTLGFGTNRGHVYVTIQHSETLRSNEGAGGRFESTPWIRLQPIEEFTVDGKSLVLAVLEIDEDGNLVTISDQIAGKVVRQVLGQSVQKLELRQPITKNGKVGEIKVASISTEDSQLKIVGETSWTTDEWQNSLTLADGAAVAWQKNSANQRLGIGHKNGGFYLFRTAANPGTVADPATYDIVVDDNGNVGVGTAAPATKLDVEGDLRLLNGVAVNEFSTDNTLADSSPSAVPTERAVKEYIDNLLIGSVTAFATDTPPDGWLECNGFALPREGKYAPLFARIGTRFGQGNGSTTFNIPDLRGQFIRGWDHGAGSDPDRNSRYSPYSGNSGDAVGSYQWHSYQYHSHGFNGTRWKTEDNLSNHTHSGVMRSYWASSQPTAAGHGYVRVLSGYSWKGDLEYFNGQWNWIGFYWQDVNATNLAHNHTLTPYGSISPSGGNETRPINASLMFCIKY